MQSDIMGEGVKVDPEKLPSEIPLVPEYVQQVFDVSKEPLTKNESTQLAELLNVFQNVFAQSEFDLGSL